MSETISMYGIEMLSTDDGEGFVRAALIGDVERILVHRHLGGDDPHRTATLAVDTLIRLGAVKIRPYVIPDGQFNLDRVVELLGSEHGISAYVEQTGGGCATIFAAAEGFGVAEVAASGGEHPFAAAAGPGWWEPGGWQAPGAVATGAKTDFCVGVDDDGESTPYQCTAADTDETVAARIAAICKEAKA